MAFGSDKEIGNNQAAKEPARPALPPLQILDPIDKKDKLLRAGQSLKDSLLPALRQRTGTVAIDHRWQAQVLPKDGSLKDAYMPSFNIYSCDHLGLLATSYNRLLTQKNISKIKVAMVEYKALAEKGQDFYVFSDYVEKFDSKLRKEQCVLLMTKESLYLFSPKDMSLITHAKMVNLEHVLMVRSNDSLVGLKMRNAKDLFLETVRRIEFVVFLQTSAELSKTKPPKIVQGSKINLSQKSHSQLVNFTAQTGSQLHLQKNFISLAPVYGYLMALDVAEMSRKEDRDKRSWNPLRKAAKAKTGDDYKFTERFFVLGSLGLIMMEKPNAARIDFY
jgi:hypothetical protein